MITMMSSKVVIFFCLVLGWFDSSCCFSPLLFKGATSVPPRIRHSSHYMTIDKDISSLSVLADLRERGFLTLGEYNMAKSRLLGLSSSPADSDSAQLPATPSNIPNRIKMKKNETDGISVERKPVYTDFNKLIVRPRVFVDTEKNKNVYRLELDCFPTIKRELESFLTFMTEANVYSQESPIRFSTAQVYIRHARLFLGWLLGHKLESADKEMMHINISCWNHDINRSDDFKISTTELSLHHVFYSKEKEAATVVFEFLKWLRTERKVSASYESNMIRGLIKLAKFRFSTESQVEIGYGGKIFDDIPFIRELRKLHRDATKLSSLTPRVAKESLKWISWSEYIDVVESTRCDLELLIMECAKTSADNLTDGYMKGFSGGGRQGNFRSTSQASYIQVEPSKSANIRLFHKTAVKYQQYLLLAFFAYIPDRQRTFRELVLGQTFFKSSLDETTSLGDRDCYMIKHGPNDYKTGRTYGDRPPLVLDASLTEYIDNYIQSWRRFLNPKCDNFFLQTSTGQPISSNGVYRTVAKACYEKTGKKTNPHLLRDMIVTHVRGKTDASEMQLEALALYMGHSIQMQRVSYDRRSLEQKVAPAVNLLHSLGLKQ